MTDERVHVMYSNDVGPSRGLVVAGVAHQIVWTVVTRGVRIAYKWTEILSHIGRLKDCYDMYYSMLPELRSSPRLAPL